MDDIVMREEIVDVVGVGAGPFNLSIAALLKSETSVSHRFFDRRGRFDWHPGMLIPGTTIQNSFLKDLVSFADPINPLSFLAFLHSERRLYEYVNSGVSRTSRIEFNQYLRWAADRLPSISWGVEVSSVAPHPLGFSVSAGSDTIIARDLVLGTGPVPFTPVCAREALGENVFHSSEYMHRRDALASKSICVVGGGQSGAEIVLDLLNQVNPPAEIAWVSARPAISPIDESHFANEIFTPAYIEHFWNLTPHRKQETLASQMLASDGISHETIAALYQKFYAMRFLEERIPFRVLPGRRLSSVQANAGSLYLEITIEDHGGQEGIACESLILATGYRQNTIPGFASALLGRVKTIDQTPVVKRDFSLEYDGVGRVFVVNAARHSHGVSDPNLSTSAWRAAVIVNAVLGRERYTTPQSSSISEFGRACVKRM